MSTRQPLREGVGGNVDAEPHDMPPMKERPGEGCRHSAEPPSLQIREERRRHHATRTGAGPLREKVGLRWAVSCNQHTCTVQVRRVTRTSLLGRGDQVASARVAGDCLPRVQKSNRLRLQRHRGCFDYIDSRAPSLHDCAPALPESVPLLLRACERDRGLRFALRIVQNGPQTAEIELFPPRAKAFAQGVPANRERPAQQPKHSVLLTAALFSDMFASIAMKRKNILVVTRCVCAGP